MAQNRRILITGISTYWGGRLAEALERRPDVDAIIGVDSKDPTRALDRTEFVRVSNQHALIRRIVQAAEIDTVVDSRLIVDSAGVSRQAAHENNVIGTLNIVAACAGPDSPVRKLVFKSSAHYYGCAREDPAFFTEDMKRSHPPATPLKRDIIEAESAVADFREKNDAVTVTTMRFCNVLGPDMTTSHARLLALPAVPVIAGFDPRYQFIHADDVVSALEFAVVNEVPGVYNAAPDGVLALSEIIGLLGKRAVPVLPPFGTAAAASALRRTGIVITPEMLGQLRYGRGLDNRRLKSTGYKFAHTTRETVERFSEHLRLRTVLKGVAEPYRYEKEVEDFLRWSPSVRKRTYDEPARFFPPAPDEHEARAETAGGPTRQYR
jgi:UDP-glucose 4-epimerase